MSGLKQIVQLPQCFDALLLQFQDLDFVHVQPNSQTDLLRYLWEGSCDLINFDTGCKCVLMKV